MVSFGMNVCVSHILFVFIYQQRQRCTLTTLYINYTHFFKTDFSMLNFKTWHHAIVTYSF